MMSKLSKEITDHINIVINREIDKYKKLLKGAKKNSDTQTQYDMARVVYADKIEFLQDLKLKLLTESVDDINEKLDYNAIFGGEIIFPNYDLLRDNEADLLPIIFDKFANLCITNKRKLKLGDSISVFVQHESKIKEIFICVKERNIYTTDFHRDYIVTIDEITTTGSTSNIDLTIIS